jgi:CRP-like cAMP-binding protein
VKLFKEDEKVETLGRAPLFEGLSHKELADLAQLTEDMEIPAGKVLIKEGDIGQEFFVIVDGDVEVTRDGQPVATRGNGEFVGEIALLEDTPRMATVTAKTPLRVFVLTRRDFRHLVDQNPEVERKVLRTLAQRLVDLTGDPTIC